MKYEIISLQPLKVENSSYVNALNYLEREGRIKVRFMEYSILKHTQVILRGLEKTPVSRVFKNILGLLDLFMSTGKTILVGAAPDSAIVFLLNRLKSRHKIIFATSWPYWDGERFSEITSLPYQKKAWYKFMDGTLSVGITKTACESIAKYGAIAYHIPHSVDTNLFRANPSRPYSNSIKVLFVGHFLKLKGIHLLLDIIKKHTWQNTEFWFVGKGPYKKHIIKMQEEHYPVKYFGYINDKKKLVSIYQNSDIFVLPSLQIGKNEEKFGIVLIEAMSCQVPVITSDCIGPREIVENGKTGLIIPQNDEVALKEAIHKLANSPELRFTLGRNGREAAEKTYDVKRIASQWMEVIEKVFQEGLK